MVPRHRQARPLAPDRLRGPLVIAAVPAPGLRRYALPVTIPAALPDDMTTARSLLQLSLPQAMAILDVQGAWLDGNAEGRRMYAEVMRGALRARLDLALAQLRSNPD